ncbi:unnamed protein product [Heligmosomoides polygyrus]|uniref:START domain-containing protein n=1 Tax=Heligmosomoides polygyrus TaxID=6339 RepID=A0A183FZR3_HELPZ|nr:unnamed protein product [Heligmosomoides polygyrus]
MRSFQLHFCQHGYCFFLQNSIPGKLENHHYVIYQLVLMLRSHIAAVLSSRGISFWSMQQVRHPPVWEYGRVSKVVMRLRCALQDSIWTENFVAMDVEEHYPDSLLIFDTVGNDQVSAVGVGTSGPILSAANYKLFIEFSSFPYNEKPVSSSIRNSKQQLCTLL